MSTRVTRSGKADSVRREVERKVMDKAIRGNRAVAEEVLAMSQELVPEDTGVLKRSGRVGERGSDFDTVFTVGYGGLDIPAEYVVSKETSFIGFRKASDYAVRQHEEVMAHSKGKADYLRDVLNFRRDDLRRVQRTEVMK
jgi:hypothetical protein